MEKIIQKKKEMSESSGVSQFFIRKCQREEDTGQKKIKIKYIYIHEDKERLGN